MQILLISNESAPQILWGQPFPFDGSSYTHVQEPTTELLQATSICIDLSFEDALHRAGLYKEIGKPIMINSCNYTLQQLGITQQPILRFNNWPSFSQSNKLEIAVHDSSFSIFESIFQQWKIDTEKTSDTPGFVSARIVAMIINEAFLALEENVSTKQEIDTAMKLGTNYPKGPFEWCDVIGARNICELLETLAAHEPRYSPSLLLKQKANEQ